MAELADQGAIWALGLMSGTSLDGVDAALLKTDGVTIEAFGEGRELAYAPQDVSAIAEVMARPLEHRGEPGDVLSCAEQDVVRLHAAAVTNLLTETDAVPDLIGFHGQTVFHAPDEGWTWQIGDGASLARILNRPVVWDFRSNDMRHGGEGAPLAPFYHWALARHIGATEPLAFLNIGGVANVTWVDPMAASPEAKGALLAFDTGPGNALLNDWMLRKTGVPMDRDGKAAAKGTAAHEVLNASNAAMDYLSRIPPKSLDRNAFAAVLAQLKEFSVENGAATLAAMTVSCIEQAVCHMPAPPSRWLVCGGGRRNPVMMRMLAERLSSPVEAVETAGLDGDLLEAQAFAYLAVRAARGLPLSAPSTTGCRTPVAGGILSYP